MKYAKLNISIISEDSSDSAESTEISPRYNNRQTERRFLSTMSCDSSRTEGSFMPSALGWITFA